MAPFIDGGRTVDRTNWSTTVISYYPFGGAIALALDLTLRERSDGRVSLDDFMRAMWRDVRQAGRRARRLRRSSVHDRRRRSDGWPRSAATARSRTTSSRATSTATRSPTTRGCSARAGLRAAQTRCRRAPGSAICDSTPARRRGARRDAGRADLAGLRSRARAGRRAAAAGRAADRVGGRYRRGAAAGTSRAIAIDLMFVNRTGVATTASVTLAEDPHIEIVAGRSGGRDADRRAEGIPRALARAEVDELCPGSRLIDAALGVTNFALRPAAASRRRSRTTGAAARSARGEPRRSASKRAWPASSSPR